MTLQAVTVQHSGKGEAERLAEAERILSDKINGMPVSQIMEKYGLSRKTVYRRVSAAVEARIIPTVDEYREQMNSAYDEQVVRANQNLAACLVLVEQAAAQQDLAASERAIALHQKAVELLNRTREAQRKLNGLDAPARAEVSVTVTTPTDNAIEALVAEFADAPAAG